MDASDLRTRDIKTIRLIFVEMLQAVFHPRINYPSLPSTRQAPPEPVAPVRIGAEANGESNAAPEVQATPNTPPDETPLPDVPPLRRVPRSDQETKPLNGLTDSEQTSSETEQDGDGT